MHRQVHVRKSRTGAQRSKSTAIEFAETGIAESPTPPSPPGMKEVTRTERKPADAAPAAETESKSTAESKERNISRRPNRTIERVSIGRTRPPSPTSADLHPAPVVIRSPAPVIVRDPGPSPIRLINPTPIAIRSPASRLVWPPHWTIIRNFRPRAMAVQIFGSDVIVVRVPPRFRVADHVVAIGVPLVPIIPRRRFADFVLRVCARACDGNELTLSDARAALRSRNFDFAFADQYFRVIVRGNQNSKAGFTPLGANGNVRRIDFRVRIAALVDGVIRHSVSKLNLDLRARQLRDVGLRVLRQSERVGIVKLKFSARLVAG